MSKLYYAHAMCLYGTIPEEFELRRIKSAFGKAQIVNPAKYSRHPDKLKDTIGFCLRLVEKCDVVVFSRVLGKVTAGVGREVNHAIRLGRPVFELAGSKLKRRKNRVEYISRTATCRLYRLWKKSLWSD
jgi:hypothetical protein